MRLFSYFRSSSAWRVRIALNYKQVPHQLVPVHLLRGGGEQHATEFRALSPLGQVPVLELPGVDGPLYLTQSMAIVEYLEEVYPDPTLLPASAELRARTRELAEIVNAGIQPLQNLRLQQELRARGLDPVPLVRAGIEAGLSALERRAATLAGRFLVGDAVSMADVLLVPQLYVARRHGVAVEAFPTLLRAERAAAELPAFQGARPEAQPDYEHNPPA